MNYKRLQAPKSDSLLGLLRRLKRSEPDPQSDFPLNGGHTVHHPFPHPATTTVGRVIGFVLALLVQALPVQAMLPFLQYLHASASQGEAESQFILGLTYRDGWEGTIKICSIAAHWCDLAAELGDQRPELVFGLLQQDKVRVQPDPAKAVECLTRAAELGNDYARVILGEMLLEGNGVPTDWRNGAEWIRKSAHAGFFPAQFRLGIIYLIGDSGMPKNEVEALAWFILAAEAGSKPAQHLRDERTQALGREVALLAIKRSRTLLTSDGPESAGGG